MWIKHIKGYELQKEKPNTSEDFFNRSEVEWTDGKVTKRLELLYVRFFEDQLSQDEHLEKDMLISTDTRKYGIKDVAAWLALEKGSGYLERRRAYINDFSVFSSLFKQVDWKNMKKRLEQLEQTGQFELHSIVRNHQ